MTNSHFQGDIRPPRLFIAIALLLALLGAMGLLAQLARVSTGDSNPDPRDSGEHQEISVRSQLEREGYEQPYGKTDAEIRANLKIEGKAADVVGYNPKTGRWLVAESKGGDIDSAFKQVKNTFEFLQRKNPQLDLKQIDLRIYTSSKHFARLSEADIAGWRINPQYELGWVGESNEWIFASVEGIKVLVYLAP